jgi:hypothetical protein
MGATKEQPGQSGMEILAGTVPPPPEAMLEKMNSSALFNPCGLAVSLDGRIYIADTGHHRICVLEDGVLSVLAGTGARGCADGRGCEAMFAHPCGLAISPEGYLFVAVRPRPAPQAPVLRARTLCTPPPLPPAGGHAASHAGMRRRMRATD